MSIWYMARADRVIAVEAIKVTAKTITYNEEYWGQVAQQTSPKKSLNKAFFETFEEAKAHLLSQKDVYIDMLKRRLQIAQSARGNILSMKEPTK